MGKCLKKYSKDYFIAPVILSLVLFVLVPPIPAQEDTEFPLRDFIGEGLWTLMHSTELIFDEPLLAAEMYAGLNERSAQKRKQGWESGLYMRTEVMHTVSTGAVYAPVRFQYRHFRVGAVFPYYMRREIPYNGFDAQAAGFGDMSVFTETSFRISRSWFMGKVSVKLPTGETTKTDRYDGKNYPVPLGTGTFDYSFGISTIIPLYLSSVGGDYDVVLDWSYRINGIDEKHVKTSGFTTEAELQNGHMYWMNAAVVKPINYELDVFVSGLFFESGYGETSWIIRHTNGLTTRGTESHDQRVVMIDVAPGICWHLPALSVRGLLEIPVMTSRDKANNERERSVTLKLGLTYVY